MRRLAQILELQKKPFYSKGCQNEQDRKDERLYYQLEEELENNAKKLKKGDKVRFMWAEKIKCKKTKENHFGFDLKWHILEGEVRQPLKTSKTSAIKGVKAKDAGDYVRESKVVKVVSGNYVFPVSPNKIEKI